MMAALGTKILGHPILYILAQRLVGAGAVRQRGIDALDPAPGHRILDIGCGPAYYLHRLWACDYHGFDTDSNYITYARRRFGHRGNFYDEPYTLQHPVASQVFDRVMLMGLLHHLDDDACHALLQSAALSLGSEGRAVTLDTVLFDGQSRLSRLLASKDRGLFVRSPEDYLALGRRHFRSVEHRLLGDTWRIPSAHFLMVLSEPLGRPTPDSPD